MRTLPASGAVSRRPVEGRDGWRRLPTAPTLHADAPHIPCAGLALLLIGRLSEGLLGRAGSAATFVVSALCGSARCGSALCGSAPSVGASGAIAGLFAATRLLSHHLPSGPTRSVLQVRRLRRLIPARVPVVSGGDHAAIDHGAHLGGASGRIAAGVAMLALWRRGAPRPRAGRRPRPARGGG